MTPIKIVCKECGQIYTYYEVAGFCNRNYSLLKSSKILGYNAKLFTPEGITHKRVCENCYKSDFEVYF